MLLVDMEQARDGGCGLNAHAACVVVAGSLARAPRLDVALGDPWPMEENDNLVILHAGGVVKTLRLEIVLEEELTEAPVDGEVSASYHHPNQFQAPRGD